MCAVVGFSSPRLDGYQKAALVRLMRNSKIRGLHAFGIAYKQKDAVVVRKDLELTPVLDAILEIPEGRGINLIAHCRYSTSGDYNVPANNQPIALVQSNLYLAFNGVIDMGTKAEMEAAHGVSLTSENDGELFLNWLLQDPVIALERVRSGRFSFAGAWLWNGSLYALRNSKRPLWRENHLGASYLASTRDILQRSGIGPGTQLKEGEAVAWH